MFRSIAGCGDTLLPAVISLTVLSGIAELFRLCLYLWSAARKSLFIYLHISQRRAKLGSPLKKPRFPHQISSATRWFFFKARQLFSINLAERGMKTEAIEWRVIVRLLWPLCHGEIGREAWSTLEIPNSGRKTLIKAMLGKVLQVLEQRLVGMRLVKNAFCLQSHQIF